VSLAAPAIATPGLAAYLRDVSLTRLVRLLTLFALVLSPISMVVGTSAQAGLHHASAPATTSAAAMEHCHDTEAPADEGSGPSPDCAVACAATIPELGDPLSGVSPLPAGLRPPILPSLRRGLEPEAADPPPRSA
jgi:hypothetical protein